MTRFQRYGHFYQIHQPAHISAANNHEVFSIFRLNESDILRYAVFWFDSRFGTTRVTFVAGRAGFSTLMRQQFRLEDGDLLEGVVDLDTGDPVPFEWKVEVNLAA